jgi:transcriptional regulator with XRE-family HTH domain
VGELGANLKAARTRLGLTQEQVAERSGVHATEVSRIEAGKRDPQVSTVVKLAKAVELPPGRLLE